MTLLAIWSFPTPSCFYRFIHSSVRWSNPSRRFLFSSPRWKVRFFQFKVLHMFETQTWTYNSVSYHLTIPSSDVSFYLNRNQIDPLDQVFYLYFSTWNSVSYIFYEAVSLKKHTHVKSQREKSRKYFVNMKDRRKDNLNIFWAHSWKWTLFWVSLMTNCDHEWWETVKWSDSKHVLKWYYCKEWDKQLSLNLNKNHAFLLM